MSVSITTVKGMDGYPLAVHIYEPVVTPNASLVILHGVVSHAEWLAPITGQLVDAGIRVLCPDRRGAGLNEQTPGDAPDAQTLIDDVVRVIGECVDPAIPLHVGGFCWGATYMINVLQQQRFNAVSLIMIAPSIFPAADIGAAELSVGDSAVATEVPNVPIDRFTSGPAYEQYILPDTRRTHYVSPRFNGILVAMNRMLAPRWAKLKMPTLMVLADNDRLSDSDKHERAFASLRVAHKQCITLAGQHGLQFDAPHETARSIKGWVHGSWGA